VPKGVGQEWPAGEPPPLIPSAHAMSDDVMTPCAPGSSAARDPREAGFSLVEMLVASLVVIVALSAFLRSIVGSMSLAQANREMSLAPQAARQMLEVLASEPIAEVFARYNGDAADDPGGAGTAPGQNFAVPGLDPRRDDPDGMVGQILFPTPGLSSGQLSEQASATFQEMPKDLNLDGDLVDGDVSADYVILPVIVRLQWTSASGTKSLFYKTILGPR